VKWISHFGVVAASEQVLFKDITVESCKEKKNPVKNVFHVDEKRLDQGTN